MNTIAPNREVYLPDFLKGGNKLKLGQALYLPKYSQRIVIEVNILELYDIYHYPEKDTSIWHHYDIWGTNRATYGVTGSVNFEYLEMPVEELSKYRLVNQFPWVDEPIGHAAYVGDDSFLTLKEARRWILPSKKKHLRRRLKESRSWWRDDIKKMDPEYRAIFTDTNKRIFVRKH